MPISTSSDNASQLQVMITNTLAPFLESVKAWLKDSKKPLKLQLSAEELALFAAYVSPLLPSLCVISSSSAKQTKELHHTITNWQTSSTWHVIEMLTEQELAGTIITPQSIGTHHLLNRTPNHHFLISAPFDLPLLPNPTAYKEKVVSFQVGDREIMRDAIIKLTQAGYIRQQTTLDIGTFKVIGETIEIRHLLNPSTYRLTFHGSTIERIVATTDRRSKDIATLTLPPLTLPPADTPITAIYTDHTVIAPQQYESENIAIVLNALTPDLVFPIQSHVKLPNDIAINSTIILYQNFDHVRELSSARQLSNPTFIPHALSTTNLTLQTNSTLITTEKALTGQSRPSASPITHARARELIGELTPGKPAVHTDHGIGIFEGIETRTINNDEREYLMIRYAEGDAISVPVEFAHKVTPYIGEKTPLIHRLHGTSWIKTKKRAQHDAAQFAKELLAIAQKRAAHTRPAYTLNSTVEAEIEQSFPFTLTIDQDQTWQEVQQDMESDIPLDRLIVGDVGFGKTEIAMRAAYHAIKNGRQVALLAPTTLLVQQHFDTFKERLKTEANTIGMLSRFTNAREQKKTRSGLADGSLLIGIGTHALLSSRTEWKNLGLVIIDEEQRFGVKHKEHFKKIRAQVDVLSLSATPIPRTLSMALSGLRNLSIIATPPPNRKDVLTTVARVNDEILAKALTQELSRQGQIYIVAPKIRQLAAIKEYVHALVPKARLAVAHGQMPDEALSKIIHQFDQGAIDILISSTIVENGLDLPHANTMIVWHAPHFGLADLYQLRGRIGRRAIQGYAYFLYDQAELTPVQKQRLAALTEASRLGSGWLIAQRDLEIRGAGNLLGAEQSGTVTSVGVQLYMDMVKEAYEEGVHTDVAIELPLPSLLPTHYISDSRERTRWYGRLSRATTMELPVLIDHLEQTFGSIPKETQNLIRLIRLQQAAAKAGITSINSQKISPADEYPYDRLEVKANKLPETLMRLQSLGNWRVRQDKATLDIDTINEVFIDKLITALSP